MEEDARAEDRSLSTGSPQEDELRALAAQLDLTIADAQVAWDTVLGGLAAGEETAEVSTAERFNADPLLDLLGGGKKLDLAETAKDELVKAVAKKLDIDPAQAGAVVDMILKIMDKPAPRRRKKPAKKTSRKAASKRKRPTAGPSSSRPKKKPASAANAKPVAKKRRPTAKPAAESGTRPKAKKRPAGAKPKPAAGNSTGKPRRPSTRGDAAVSETTA